MFKKVFYNTGAQIVGKTITASITLLITFIIFRNLGPAGYGDFTKIFVFVGYFYTLADFGLNAIYIKLSAQSHSRSEAEASLISYLRPLLGLRILIGVTLALVAASIAYFLPYNPQTSTGFSPLVKTGIAIGAFTIITQSLFITANAFFQKILRYDLSTIAAVAGYLVVLTWAVIVSFAGKSLLLYTTAYVLGGITLVLVAYVFIASRVGQFFTPSFSQKEFLAFIKPAWPVGLALLFNLIYFRIDVLILSNFSSSTEVGLYGLAYQFFEASLAVPIFFANSIYPQLTNLYKTDIGEFRKQVGSWSKILILASIIIVVGLVIASLLIPIIFGRQSAGAVIALQILALGVPFFFISALLWYLLIIYDKQKFLTIIYAVGALFNIVANLMFIPSYGYIAASVITVVSEALITLMLFLAIRLNKT